jgi:hypothetical protein
MMIIYQVDGDEGLAFVRNCDKNDGVRGYTSAPPVVLRWEDSSWSDMSPTENQHVRQAHRLQQSYLKCLHRSSSAFSQDPVYQVLATLPCQQPAFWRSL